MSRTGTRTGGLDDDEHDPYDERDHFDENNHCGGNDHQIGDCYCVDVVESIDEDSSRRMTNMITMSKRLCQGGMEDDLVMMVMIMILMSSRPSVREEWRISPWKLQQARYNHGTLTVPGDMFPQCS